MSVRIFPERFKEEERSTLSIAGIIPWAGVPDWIIRSWAWVMYPCNPNMKEVEEGGSKVLDHPWVHSFSKGSLGYL